MAIDWSSDHFVRLYTRETDDDLLLTWEARAVWHELLKKFNKQGRLTTKRGVRGLAALIRIPLDVVERVIPELAEDGRLKADGNTFYAPNYQHANYTPRSSGARMAQFRSRTSLHGAGGSGGRWAEGTDSGQATKNGDGSHGASVSNSSTDLDDEHVTDSDAALRIVTAVAHIRSEAEAVHSARARGRHAIPSDWKPRERECQLARELGLDPDSEAREFLAYWQGDGRAKADWDQTFASRLQAQAKHKPRRPGGLGGQDDERKVEDL